MLLQLQTHVPAYMYTQVDLNTHMHAHTHFFFYLCPIEGHRAGQAAVWGPI